jgi:hypothetical protein
MPITIKITKTVLILCATNKLRKKLSHHQATDGNKTTRAKLLAKDLTLSFLPIFYKPKQVTPIIFYMINTCFRQRLYMQKKTSENTTNYQNQPSPNEKLLLHFCSFIFLLTIGYLFHDDATNDIRRRRDH